MDVVSLTGVPASAAGAPLAQAKGADPDRLRVENDRRRVEQQGEQKADAAAGADENDDQDKAIGDREGDGRQAWEIVDRSNRPVNSSPATAEPRSRDPRRESGNQIDLCG